MKKTNTKKITKKTLILISCTVIATLLISVTINFVKEKWVEAKYESEFAITQSTRQYEKSKNEPSNKDSIDRIIKYDFENIKRDAVIAISQMYATYNSENKLNTNMAKVAIQNAYMEEILKGIEKYQTIHLEAAEAKNIDVYKLQVERNAIKMNSERLSEYLHKHLEYMLGAIWENPEVLFQNKY